VRIALGTPFKPLDHPRISGDVTIARDLMDALTSMGEEVEPAPGPATTRIWERPEAWPALLRARRDLLRRRGGTDAWLTYHSYYKAPDLLGPLAARAGLPYCIFSAAYAEKRGEQPENRPGFLLNRRALLAADHLFMNKRDDYETCSRLVPKERLTYVRPGIRVERFAPAPDAREGLRAGWGAAGGGGMVAVCAAMLRAGVKVQGVEWTIRALGGLLREGLDVRLVLAGDGPARLELEALARVELPGRAVFLGAVPRERLREVYSAGDVFVFPGINEGLGMVYLEAQCCGLPCVAFDHMGAPEVVASGAGCITPSFEMEPFTGALRGLARHPERRRAMGEAARRFVLDNHDASRNYVTVREKLLELAQRKQGRART
jgi:glycosyltransferase involved in cell wall biosynthesis